MCSLPTPVANISYHNLGIEDRFFAVLRLRCLADILRYTVAITHIASSVDQPSSAFRVVLVLAVLLLLSVKLDISLLP
jgi:hypothetical protein